MSPLGLAAVFALRGSSAETTSNRTIGPVEDPRPRSAAGGDRDRARDPAASGASAGTEGRQGESEGGGRQKTAWWWSNITKPLADHGIATAVVPLPSCGEAGETLGDLYDDVDACRQAIAEADEPVVLCGHSYGGVIITEAGADDRVTQLLYLTSVMPDAGQSQADLIGSEPVPWLAPSHDGTVGVDPDMIREFFLQDCDEATTEQALTRLTRQSLAPFTQPPRQIAWQHKSRRPTSCAQQT